MMKISKILSLVLLVLTFSGCKKQAESIFTLFKGVKVTFEDRGPHAIVRNTVVNDGDSANIYYKITSENEDMFKVRIETTDGMGDVDSRDIEIPEGERRSYSGVIRWKMERDGKTTFRIFALDEENVFLGDGYTSITVEGKASYTHLANRKIYSHIKEGDQVTGAQPTFFSLTTGETYNYEEAAANSGKVDFGIYTLIDMSEQNYGDPVFNVYSINAPVNPLPELDISGWEKRNTLFSEPITGASGDFTEELVSASMIQKMAEEEEINLLYTEINTAGDGFEPGNLLYFLTPEGKYGAIYVNQKSRDEKGEYLSVGVKIQK